MSRRGLSYALLGVTLLISACDATGVSGPTSGRIARIGGGTTASSALVGAWRRAIFFFDEFNYSRSSETTFQFAADGTALRTIVARNHTLGYADVLVSAGRWRVSGTTLVIDFSTPSLFTLELQMRVVGDQLELAGQTYIRIGG